MTMESSKHFVKTIWELFKQLTCGNTHALIWNNRWKSKQQEGFPGCLP